MEKASNCTTNEIDEKNSKLTENESDDTNQANNKQQKKKKNMFTKEEDKKLIEVVEEYGDNDWGFISSFFENRTRRQCCERWKKYLCPTVNVSSWSKEEDELLIKKYNENGPKWTFISKSFKNRTDVNIKTRFIVLNRKMRREQNFIKKVKKLSRDNLRNYKALNIDFIQSKQLKKKLINIDQSNNQNTNEEKKKNDDDEKLLKNEVVYDINPKKSFFGMMMDHLIKTVQNDVWNEFGQEAANIDYSSIYYL